jgi:ribosomal protein L11 methyltransferase
VIDLQAIKDSIVTLLGQGTGRLTPLLLEKAVCGLRGKIPRRLYHTAVKELVQAGMLIYTHRFSMSQLELNYHRQIKISNRIILSPAENNNTGKPGGFALIKLLSGAAFGMGDHPTTRISLKTIEFVLAQDIYVHRTNRSLALDIGTGAGVLASAAVQLGIDEAIGIDIDPVARYEARRNVTLNTLDDKIRITSDTPERLLPKKFDLIIANLRPPTLRSFFPAIKKLSEKRTCWVLSGFRCNEKKSLIRLIEKMSGQIFWENEEMCWSSMAVCFGKQA